MLLKSFAHLHVGLAMVAFAMISAGCSGEHDYGPTGRITGRLTMDGKPLEPGHTVSFMQPEAGFLAFGETDLDGNFEVQSWNGGNMPVGTYRVMVQPPASGLDPESAEAAELALSGGGGVAEARFPDKYRATTTSGLEYKVEEGENNFEIDLEPR